MCGIIGCVGREDAAEPILSGLENLEYRGYDSAGVAVRNGSGLDTCKRAGEISALRDTIRAGLASGPVGIGHTRWSTHGAPTDANAHPHADCTGDVAVVHNGIIENHADLRADLEARGHEFRSETDTEVVPHLIEERLADGLHPAAALRDVLDVLEGSYALAVIVADSDELYAARRGSPLLLGIGDGAAYVASDAPAFLDATDRAVFLHDGDVATLSADGYVVTDGDGAVVERPERTIEWAPEDARKEGYDHYMLKEIHEQPHALERTLQGRLDAEAGTPTLDFPPGAFADAERVHLVGCGTSNYAAEYGATLLRRWGVEAQALLASEYTGAAPRVDGDTLVVAVTQSGETADTLSALRFAAERGARTLAVTNVVGSTAARECDDAMFIRAGPEIGVAASKTFSSQVASLVLLAATLVRDGEGAPGEEVRDTLRALADLPDQVATVLDGTTARSVAERYAGRESYFFIGRGLAYPVAMEGALKFKEISYEHAEGFPAGELKHGPLALVTEHTPVIAVFAGRHDEKTLNNVQEVQARGAPVIAVAGERADAVRRQADETLAVPDTHPNLAGLLANVQLQLVAYHVSKLLDRAIDKPRNLAKSVTVE
ncbi:glutamine--fructose-6-phosphate transaminase (isomerizing) [Halosegnis marinus]|uniref:Glutamine--fructose-6-phosphate aminotransferase [isomerizing] n=1 Tax=Halosegnis marinus TaxID=3034023 RepID=A0ABD5ZR99_9EURY|nr:glutamine--fructose-6-phosphate transaminase (isomerizing) [Halosegnis sp. DT85]